MKTPLSETTSIYETLSNARVNSHLVQSVEVESLARAVNEFSNLVKSRGLEGVTISLLLRALRQILFDLRSIPCPIRETVDPTTGRVQSAYSLIQTAKGQHPELDHQISLCFQALEALVASEANPLGDAIRGYKEGVFVCVASRQLSFMQDHFKRDDLAIVPMQSLARLTQSHLIITGNPRWYPEWFFSAPLSQETNLYSLHFEYIRAPTNRVLPEDLAQIGEPVPFVQKRKDGAIYSTPSTYGDIEPTLDWTAVRHTVQNREVDGNSDMVEAYLLVIGEGDSIYLDASNGAETECVRESQDGLDIYTKETQSIKKGDYLLVRLEGGGAMIPVIADLILGNVAHRLRTIQSSWKAELAQRVEEMGLFPTAIKLLDLGGENANETNVRNWCRQGPTPIHPREKADFKAVTELIGMSEELDKLWNDMRIISRAHQKAGIQIRNTLREVLKGSSEMLYNHKRLDIHLESGQGGSMSAMVVMGVDEKLHKVPRHNLHRLFEVHLDG